MESSDYTYYTTEDEFVERNTKPSFKMLDFDTNTTLDLYDTFEKIKDYIKECDPQGNLLCYFELHDFMRLMHTTSTAIDIDESECSDESSEE